VRKNEVLWGECIAGSLKVQDFDESKSLYGWRNNHEQSGSGPRLRGVRDCVCVRVFVVGHVATKKLGHVAKKKPGRKKNFRSKTSRSTQFRLDSASPVSFRLRPSKFSTPRSRPSLARILKSPIYKYTLYSGSTL
jgi:hypothetical protein